jgi:PTH1 family peptidyl-tRNA hydrolase
MMIDLLARHLGATGEKKQGRSLIRAANQGERRLLLAKPQAFMNRSGDPLWELLAFYKNAIEGFIVVHDDMDLPLGRMRFREDGGTGGHRGVQSIISRLGSGEFDRLKIGVGRPPGFMAAEDYVLQAFSAGEKTLLGDVLDKGMEGILYWLAEGCTNAMNKYNAGDLRGND